MQRLQALVAKKIVLPEPHPLHPHRADLIGLIKEMTEYSVACQDQDYAAIERFKEKAQRLDKFWHDPTPKFPTWAKLAFHLMVLQQSSAAAERVFSRLIAILKRPGMDTALIDYVESIVMHMYNGADWEDDAD